jgi:hypothetical protein
MTLVATIIVVTDQISPVAIVKITHIAIVTICSSVMLYIIGLSFVILTHLPWYHSLQTAQQIQNVFPWYGL